MTDYKKKYKEALERAKQIQSTPYTAHWDVMKDVVEDIFPELKESEDEKIRKALRERIIRYDPNNEILIKEEGISQRQFNAWLEKQVKKDEEILVLKDQIESLRAAREALKEVHKIELEKQGEQKPIDNLTQQEAMDIAVGKCFEKGEQKPQGKTALEAVKEERVDNQNCVKPADKVEPKFHEGEWIVHHGTENIYQVVARIDNQYQLKYGDNYTIQNCVDVDRCSRLYDVAKDAKDGDVLHCWIDGDEFVLIYKGIKDGYITTYGHLYQKLKLFSEYPSTMFCRTIQGHFTPATKEQCDLLFSKIKEAGYEWNVDKKELKKIEQKPADKTPYPETLEKAIDLYYYSYGNGEGEFEHLSLEKFRDIVRTFVSDYGQKPAWSEEDDQMIKNVQNDYHNRLGAGIIPQAYHDKIIKED